MKLEEIKDPKFLKKLKKEELEELSKEIREFIIDKVSKTGGHLSSNLGVVELTIAIHKVFDCPKDKIIFDVSHQSYTHKILTGRAKYFDSLRQTDGLSGFQKRAESIYDSYEGGHSSTSLSAGLGFAFARDLDKKNNNVIAVIGDGSITNGLCYEALNQIGSTKTKLIIILNDNNMSISKNVGAIHNYLDRIRLNNEYENAKNKTKRILSKIPIIGSFIYYIIKGIKSGIKKLYVKDGLIFEELGLDYYGPINGHDFDELINYLTLAKKSKNPVIIHVITEKGKGYKYALEDKLGNWHGVGPFNKETGEFLNKSEGLTSWSEIISDSIIRLMNKDIVVITPAMSVGSKLTKFSQMYKNNFIDVGMAEEHALIFANALAVENKIPITLIYSSFLQRGYDETVHDIARMNTHVIVGIDRCGIVGEDGETHQGVFDLTFLLPIPNIIIASPRNSIEATNLLQTAIKNKSPFFIRYSKKKIKYEQDVVKEIPIGTWEQIRKGNSATLITYGDFLNEIEDIIDKLNKENIKIELVNARFLKPLDMEYLKKIDKKNKKVFVYEESMRVGSLGSVLSTILKSEVIIYGINDEFVLQGKREEILKKLELDKDSIYKKIKQELRGK